MTDSIFQTYSMVLFRVSLGNSVLSKIAFWKYWAQEFDSSVLSILTTDQGTHLYKINVVWTLTH